MRRLINRVFFATRFGRRLTMLASSTMVGQLAVILTAPVLTRIYTPADYGAFVALTGLIVVLGVISGLRYEAAIPLCRVERDAATLVCVVVLTSLTISLMVALVLVEAGPWLAAVLGLGGREGVVWWLPAAVAAQGIFIAFDGWGIQQGRMRQLALSKITQGFVLALGQMLFGFWWHGSPHGLFLAFVLAQLCSIWPMLARLDRLQRTYFLFPAFANIRRLVIRYRQFPLYEIWARSFSTASEMLPGPFIAAIFGTAASGHYGLAQRIIGAPVRLLGISAHQVYAAELTRLSHTDRPALRALFNETIRHLLAVGLVYLIVIVVFGPYLFSLVFGSAWRESGEMARLLAPMYLALFVNRPIGYTVQFYERQDLGFRINLVSLVVVVVTFLLAHLNILTLTQSIVVVSGGLCATNLGSFLIARALIDGKLAAHPRARRVGEVCNAGDT
jgi:O-antigen/teichoic acid export membrane protein